jgi:hypothetical protein
LYIDYLQEAGFSVPIIISKPSTPMIMNSNIRKSSICQMNRL